MNKQTIKYFKKIFGKDKLKYYRNEIKKACLGKGKYKDDHGLFNPNIVLYINSLFDFLLMLPVVSMTFHCSLLNIHFFTVSK